MPEPIRVVLLRSGQFFVHRWRMVVGTAIVFALLTAASSAFFSTRINALLHTTAAQHGIDQMELENTLNEYFANKSFTDMAVTMETLQQQATGTGQVVSPTDTAIAQFVTESSPYMLASTVLTLIILFIAGSFFLVLAVSAPLSPYDLTHRALRALPLLAGIWLWTILRSLAWVPFVNIITVPIFFPRFVFAPIISLRTGMGVRESVRQSFLLSRGYWLAIVGMLMTLLLVLLVGVWFAAMLTGMAGVFSTKAALLLWLVCIYLLVAFIAIFQTQIAAGFMMRR